MLQLIRDKAQGIIIWIIVGLVVLALSSFILTSYLGNSAKTYIAKVNDQEISQREYRLAYNRYQQSLQQQLGDNFAKFFNQEMASKAVENSLINGALMQQLTHAAGFRTTDAAILKLLEKTPAFKQDGKFSSKLYELLLKQNGYSRTQYESQLANDQAQRQFVSGLADSAFVLKTNVADYLRLSRQQRDTAYLLIKMAELRKDVKVSDAEIQSYFDAHKSDFMTDEEVQVSYSELYTAELAGSVKVDERELRAYYESHKASYTRDDYTDAEKKIKQIAARIKKGESFAKLAKEDSQDIGSASKGGELGYISQGMMVKPFEDAAFKLKVGQVSQPVRTKFGYHLIKLEAVRNQGREQRKVSHILIKPKKVTADFDQVKAQVKNAVQLQHAEKIYYEDADKLDRLSYEYQDSLEPAAEKLGIKIKQSPFFSRHGDSGIWRDPAVIKAAFSDDVLKGSLNSELIKVGDDHTLVLRLKQHKPAQQKNLAEVKAQIEARLMDQKAKVAAEEMAKKLAKQIEAGTKADTLAAENKAVSWNDVGYIGRQAQYDAKPENKTLVLPEIRQNAFQLDKPDGAKPVVVPQQLANGDAAVIVLRAARDNPDKSGIDKELLKTQQQMTSAESQSHYKLLLEYERAHSKVEINKQQESDQDS